MKKNSYVGIDLGHFTMKVIQVEKNPQGWRVTRAGLMYTPQGAIRDGIVTDVPTVAGALKLLLKQSGVTAKSAVVSVQGASVVVRPVRVPQMTEAVLRKSIKYEAGRYVPNSIEDSFVEFEIMGALDDGQMDVLVVAAPKDLVDTRVAAATAAGLDVEIVDIGPFAAYRSLIETNQTRAWNDETIALIDFGAQTTTVSVINQGKFGLVRCVQSGSNNFTEALRTFFDLSPEDAESGKAALNVSELLEEKPKENPPLRVLHPYIDELVREIRRSINYYESQTGEGVSPSPVKTIVLTGGGARLAGLEAYLGAKLGMQVLNMGTFDNPLITNFSATEFGPGQELAVASGLAMRPWIKAA